MKTPKHSLRKIVSFLNNEEEDGGFWLPNIQRPFVWSEEQICRLFDSILREYPISTLLIWKTRSPIRRRKFIDNFHRGLLTRLSDFYVAENDNVDGGEQWRHFDGLNAPHWELQGEARRRVGDKDR